MNIKSGRKLLPLVFDRNNILIEPAKDGSFTFTNTDEIYIACPGEHIKINGSNTKTTSTNITCVSGVNFLVNGVSGQVPFNNIDCTNYPHHTARYTGRNCLNNTNYKEIEVGFDLNFGFLKSYEICFDVPNQNSLYSTFTLSYHIKGSQVGTPRPDFIQGPFYNVGASVNSLYVRNGQRKTINKLLGMPDNDYTYVGKSSDFYLSRGHLTAKADFTYGSRQRSTFYYVNVAPQWQTFNEANWNELEQSVRYFAGLGSSDVTVYTGTYGTLSFPHATTGKPVKLYLYVSKQKNGIPIPELYWKIIYDPKKQLGTAFVGVNDPYFDKHPKICKDVSSEISWLRWDQNNVTAGISYSCTVDDLRKTVKTIPSFIVKGLLK